MNETGLNEESETENVEPTTSRLINQDIESDEEMNDTMILRHILSLDRILKYTKI
jgi:hypothetical protein